MKSFFLLTLLVSLCSVPAHAVKEYYSLTRSVRALGMGGAFYALSDDQYALFYNPSGLSLYRAPAGQLMFGLQGQIAPQTLSALSTITGSGKTTSTIVNALGTYAGKPLYAGVGLLPFYVRKNFAVGLLIADTKIDVAILGRDLASQMDLTAISDNGLVIGYAQSVIDPNLHIGANLKGILRAGGRQSYTLLEIAQNNNFNIDANTLGGTGFGVDFDLGATYQLQNLVPWGFENRVSLSLNNMLATKFPIGRTSSGAPPGLPRMMTLGYYTVLPGVGPIDNFHCLLDLAEFQIGGDNRDPDLGGRTGNLFKHINFGVEAPMNGWFSARLGLRQGNLTAGLGIWLKGLRLDLATYAEEVGSQAGYISSRRFALNLTFGAGSSAAPAYSKDNWEVPYVDTKKQTPVIDLDDKAKETPRKTDGLMPDAEPAAKGIETIKIGGETP